MTDQSYVYAGVGWWRGGTRGGVFRLAAGDGECRQLTRGLPEETHVQAVTVHPVNPEIVYIGSQDGPYRSTDRGEHWERLGFPDRGVQVWTILVDPKNLRTLYAGTSPGRTMRVPCTPASARRRRAPTGRSTAARISGTVGIASIMGSKPRLQ